MSELIAAIVAYDATVKPPPAPQFSESELDAINLVRKSLESQDPKVDISEKELILCTINAKLDVEKATKKYLKWLESIKPFGFNSFLEIWKDLDLAALSSRFASYAVTGVDSEGRSVMWIKGGPIQESEERNAIKAGCVFFAAIHSDYISLRNGITFVIDTAANPMTETVGNEGKMQKSYQSMPLRPQKIFILGAGWVKRLVINALISLASLFTSEKVIERIRFAEVEEVKATVPMTSLPRYLGGEAGGLDEDIVKWVKSRIESFPTLNLDATTDAPVDTSNASS